MFVSVGIIAQLVKAPYHAVHFISTLFLSQQEAALVSRQHLHDATMSQLEIDPLLMEKTTEQKDATEILVVHGE